MPIYPPPCGDHAERDDRHVELPEIPLKRVPVLAQDDAEICEESGPQERTGERVCGKRADRDPKDAGGKRDERADDRQMARYEGRRVPKAREPALCRRNVMLADQNKSCIRKHLPPPTEAQPVRKERPGKVPKRAHKHHHPEAERSLAYEKPGERHDDLRWHGNVGALCGHKEKDAGVAGVFDRFEHEKRNCRDKIGNHSLHSPISPQEMERPSAQNARRATEWPACRQAGNVLEVAGGAAASETAASETETAASAAAGAPAAARRTRAASPARKQGADDDAGESAAVIVVVIIARPARGARRRRTAGTGRRAR